MQTSTADRRRTINKTLAIVAFASALLMFVDAQLPILPGNVAGTLSLMMRLRTWFYFIPAYFLLLSLGAIALRVLFNLLTVQQIMEEFIPWFLRKKSAVILPLLFVTLFVFAFKLVQGTPAVAKYGLEKQLNVTDSSPAFQFVFDNATDCKNEGVLGPIFSPSSQECEVRLYTLLANSPSLTESDRIAAKKMVHPVVQAIL